MIAYKLHRLGAFSFGRFQELKTAYREAYVAQKAADALSVQMREARKPGLQAQPTTRARDTRLTASVPRPSAPMLPWIGDAQQF